MKRAKTKAQEAASEQGAKVATSASIKVEKNENNESANKQNEFIKYDMHGEKKRQIWS